MLPVPIFNTALSRNRAEVDTVKVLVDIVPLAIVELVIFPLATRFVVAMLVAVMLVNVLLATGRTVVPLVT